MIVRVKKRELPFVQVEKSSVKDPRLSLKATGLLTLLLTFPDDWTIDHRSLARMKRDGEKSTRTALLELADCGYLKRRRVQDALGRWSWEQWIYETSKTNPLHAALSATRETESPKRALIKRTETDKEVSPSSQKRHSDPACSLCGGTGWYEPTEDSGVIPCAGQQLLQPERKATA